MKSSLPDAGEDRSDATMPSGLSIRSKNSKSSPGSSVTTSTATTTKKHNSKKDKPLNETPEERSRRHKEKKEEKKKKKELKEHETPEERAKRKEKRKKEKESEVASMSTDITSPAETPEEKSLRHLEKKEKKQRKKERKEKQANSNTSSSPKESFDPSASKPNQEQSLSSSVSTPTNSNVFPNMTKKGDQRYPDISSVYSSASASESATREAASSSSESTDHGDKMSVSVMTDPYFGPQQIKSDQQRSFLLHQQYQLQLHQQYQQQQYQQQQERQQMEQHQQYRQQLPSLQQHFQQAQPYTNRAISDNDYNQHFYVGNPALNNESSSIGPKGMMVYPNSGSTVRSVMDDMSVCNDDEINSVITGFTDVNVDVTLHQQKFLLRMVKTMGRKVAKAEAKIRSLGERNFQMEELRVQLTKSEEQLEYASEDNNDYSVRVRALEEALLMQETELDNALETVRKQGEARRKEELLKAEREVKTNTNPFAEMSITNPFEENSFAEETTTNPFAGNEDDEQIATTREEVAAIREELAQLQQERDMAVERVTTVAIQLAELRADTDESRDQLTESRAIMERLQAAKQQSSSNSIGNFLWAKKDAKSVMSMAADEAIDGTESTGSVSSVAWPHSDHSGDAAYEVGRRHDEASYDLVL
jgi:hypothetical protein